MAREASSGAWSPPPPAAEVGCLEHRNHTGGHHWTSQALLSSIMAPFFPRCVSSRQSKCRWWTDKDGKETDDNYSTTYLEVASCLAKAHPASPVCPHTYVGRGRVDVVQGPLRGHAGHGQMRHNRPCPQLVHGLPICTARDRICCCLDGASP